MSIKDLFEKQKENSISLKSFTKSTIEQFSGDIESADYVEQKQIYAPRGSWNERINEWTNFLSTLPQNELLISEPTSETSPNNFTSDIQNVGL